MNKKPILVKRDKDSACTKQMSYEAGLRVSADIVRNLGGRIPVDNPYSRAIEWTTH